MEIMRRLNYDWIPRWDLVGRGCAWLLDHVKLGPLAPYVFGLMMGRWPRRVRDD